MKDKDDCGCGNKDRRGVARNVVRSRRSASTTAHAPPAPVVSAPIVEASGAEDLQSVTHTEPPVLDDAVQALQPAPEEAGHEPVILLPGIP